MTGFIKGLFKKKDVDNNASASESEAPQGKGAYFLKPDDAKTFGDIDYMRTSKTVKRTFAKGDARVRQISAMNEAEVNGTTGFSQPPKPTAQPAPQTETSTFKPSSSETKRRSPDSNMDMFRNMAKDIRKG
ncbi:MAG: hypothetical protein WBA57_16680 [Elainellaceae cyanobacterium]